jgi:hypothetical protein
VLKIRFTAPARQVARRRASRQAAGAASGSSPAGGKDD